VHGESRCTKGYPLCQRIGSNEYSEVWAVGKISTQRVKKIFYDILLMYNVLKIFKLFRTMEVYLLDETQDVGSSSMEKAISSDEDGNEGIGDKLLHQPLNFTFHKILLQT
jgi:hypothetical protein